MPNFHEYGNLVPEFGHYPILLWRSEWPGSITVWRDEINPATNANGLWWAYSGIARELYIPVFYVR